MNKKEKKAREKIYDEQIAPLLLQVSDLCVANDMAMVAVVEYNPGDLGRTVAKVDDEAGLAMQMLYYCALARENVDRYIEALKRHAKENNIDMSGSIYLGGLWENPHFQSGMAAARESMKHV